VKHLPFTIAPNNINILKVTQQVKDLYNKNCKILRKKLKKISEGEKISHVHGSVELTW
jgi:cell division protein FtsL